MLNILNLENSERSLKKSNKDTIDATIFQLQISQLQIFQFQSFQFHINVKFFKFWVFLTTLCNFMKTKFLPWIPISLYQ